MGRRQGGRCRGAARGGKARGLVRMREKSKDALGDIPHHQPAHAREAAALGAIVLFCVLGTLDA